MRALVAFFVDRHLLVNILAVATVALGAFFISGVPREYIPSVSSPIVWVSAQLPGATARDIETKLTIPIEEAIEQVDGIDELTSVSSDSLSFTTVEFYLDFSDEQMIEVIQDLRDAVDGISDFPPEMEDQPTIEQFDPDKRPIVEVALSGPMDALIPYAEDLERRIEALSLVSRATIVGLQDPEVRVLVDPAAAQALGVTLLEVVRAVDRRNVSATGGVLETDQDRKQVVVWSRFDQPEDVGSTILRASADGSVVRIADIARIESGREDTGLITHTNAEPGLSIVVRKRGGADAITLVDELKVLLADHPPPQAVELSLVNDGSFYTRNRLEVIASNGLIGGALVALVLFAFIRAGAAMWVLVGVPVVFFGALALFAHTGITLNLMSLTGFILVLGMVVDDAVVVAERIDAHRVMGLSSRDAAIAGTVEMSKPVTAAALTTIIAFAPLIALGGLPGKIVWQIPAIVVIVLVFSLLESFLILPAHMARLKNRAGAGKRVFVTQLEAIYRRALTTVLRYRFVVLLAALFVLIAVFAVLRPLVPFVLFPQDDARSLFLKISAPIGTPLEQTEAIATSIQKQIQRITGDELNAVTARIGHQNPDGSDKERGEAENEALVTAIFRELDRRYTNTEWTAILQRDLIVPDGTRLVFQSEYLGPPTDQPVTLHFMSNTDEVRRSAALQARNWLASVSGVTEIDVDERLGTPQIELDLNYQRLAQLGLDARDVAQTVQAAFFGIEASEHRSVADTTELRVQFDPSARTDLQGLLDSPLRSATGSLVRLRDVVTPVQTPALNRIFHRHGFRSATVRASFTADSGLTSLAFAQRMRAELLPRFDGIEGLEVRIGGEAERTEETTGNLAGVGLLAIAGIAMVIWLTLGSALESVFVMLVIPFAVAGVIAVFWLHGMPLSMTSIMGAIGLAGVVVNGSIVMLDAIHRRVDALGAGAGAGAGSGDNAAMIDATVDRLRPVLITTLTTLGGVLPTAYGIGGYDTIVSPMSLALGWGLAVSTLVTLFVVPVLYTVARDINALTHRRLRVAT